MAATSPRLLQAGLLGDLCVLIPALYLACYWRRGRAAWLRVGGLAAVGLWGAAKLLPADDQGLLARLWPLRYLAMGALAVVELKVAVAVYRAVIGGASRQEATRRLRAWVSKRRHRWPVRSNRPAAGRGDQVPGCVCRSIAYATADTSMAGAT